MCYALCIMHNPYPLLPYPYSVSHQERKRSRLFVVEGLLLCGIV